MEFVQIGICVPHPCLLFAGIKDSLPGTDKFKGRGGINFFTQEKIAMIRFDPPGNYVSAGKQEVYESKCPKTGSVRS